MRRNFIIFHHVHVGHSCVCYEYASQRCRARGVERRSWPSSPLASLLASPAPSFRSFARSKIQDIHSDVTAGSKRHGPDFFWSGGAIPFHLTSAIPTHACCVGHDDGQDPPPIPPIASVGKGGIAQVWAAVTAEASLAQLASQVIVPRPRSPALMAQPSPYG